MGKSFGITHHEFVRSSLCRCIWCDNLTRHSRHVGYHSQWELFSGVVDASASRTQNSILDGRHSKSVKVDVQKFRRDVTSWLKKIMLYIIDHHHYQERYCTSNLYKHQSVFNQSRGRTKTALGNRCFRDESERGNYSSIEKDDLSMSSMIWKAYFNQIHFEVS